LPLAITSHAVGVMIIPCLRRRLTVF